MPFFKSLPDDAGVAHIYRAHIDEYRPWIQMGDKVMTGESPLSRGERELIATFVSVLNGCDYCHASHGATMAALGMDAGIIDQLVEDIDTADVPDRLKPVLKFCRKLTLTPARVSAQDAEAVFAAGWDEAALHAAIAVTCRFNFMNRLVMGHGLAAPDADKASKLARARVKQGYARMLNRQGEGAPAPSTPSAD